MTWLLVQLLVVTVWAQESVVQEGDREPASVQIQTIQEQQEKKDQPLVTEQRVVEDEPPSRITGDWGGFRSRLENEGYTFDLVYRGESNHVLGGGIKRESVYLGQLDLKALFDGEKIGGWRGGSFFLYGLMIHGAGQKQSPSLNVGDAQGTSNIQGPSDTIQLYEAWVQQTFFEEKLSFLLGVHDLNSEFYVTPTSTSFFNASFGVGREFSITGPNGPSIFPYTAPALRVRVEPSKSFYLQWGLFNGQAGDPERQRETVIRFNKQEDGLLSVTELGYLKDTDSGSSKYAVGFWNYTKPFDHLNASITDANGDTFPLQASSNGSYLLVDQAVAKNWSAFLRYGLASPETNRYESNVAAGVVATGLIPRREKDRLGLAVTRAQNGDEYRKAQEAEGTNVDLAETTFELTYRAEIWRGFVIQPDLQYVMDPDTNPETGDATVAAVRFEFAF